MPDRAGVADALVERLHQRGVDTLVLDRPADPGPGGHDVDSEALVRQLQDWTTAGGPVTGVYWLAALDVEPPIAELDLHAWKEGLRVRVKLLAATMRALYDQVNVPGSFLVSATRLGGRHGYDEAGATAPMGGAVTGFTKAYKRERADAHDQGRRPRGDDRCHRRRRHPPGGDPARPRRGGGRPPRRAALDGGIRGATGGRRPARLPPLARHRLRRHRRGRRHRLRHRRRPGHGIRGHLPPSRPRPRAGPGRPGPRAVPDRP